MAGSPWKGAPAQCQTSPKHVKAFISLILSLLLSLLLLLLLFLLFSLVGVQLAEAVMDNGVLLMFTVERSVHQLHCQDIDSLLIMNSKQMKLVVNKKLIITLS